MGKVSFVLGLGAGYVLGTRAGRARFEQIQQAAVSLSGRPEVQDAVGKVRESLPSSLQKTVDGLTKSTPAASGGSPPSGRPASTGSYPLEDDDEVVAQTYSALRERSPAAPKTQDPGNTGGTVPVNPAAEDEDPVSQTHSAFMERTASEPETEHTR